MDTPAITALAGMCRGHRSSPDAISCQCAKSLTSTQPAANRTCWLCMGSHPLRCDLALGQSLDYAVLVMCITVVPLTSYAQVVTARTGLDVKALPICLLCTAAGCRLYLQPCRSPSMGELGMRIPRSW